MPVNNEQHDCDVLRLLDGIEEDTAHDCDNTRTSAYSQPESRTTTIAAPSSIRSDHVHQW